MRFDIRPCLPGRAVDMRTAVLTGVLGVVFGWKYSVDIWLRFVTTIHNSIPYRLYTCKKKMPENIIHEHHMFPGSIFLSPHYPLILLISTKISTPSPALLFWTWENKWNTIELQIEWRKHHCTSLNVISASPVCSLNVSPNHFTNFFPGFQPKPVKRFGRRLQ